MAPSYAPWGIGSYSIPVETTPKKAPVYPLMPVRPTGTTLRPPGTITHGINPMYAPAGSTEQNWPYGLPGTIGPYGVIGSNGQPIQQQYGLNALAGLNGASPITSDAGATTNPFSTIRNTKSPEQEARIGQVAGDFDAARTTTGNALAEFTKKFLGNTPAAERNVAQENAVVEGYYSGDVGNTLAALRARRAAAVEAAGNRALDYERRNRNVTQLMSGGTGSSYLDRLGIKAATDQRTKEAVEQAELERKDFDYVQSGKLGLRGARTTALDALANRALVPADATNRALSELLQRLESVGRLDLANTFYGIQKPYDPNTEGYISDFSSGGPMRDYRPTAPRGYGIRPFGQAPTVRPPGSPVTTDPNFMRNFPGGGYRDQYGRWITPDPTTGQWPVTNGTPAVTFQPGWENIPNWHQPSAEILQQQDFYENPENYNNVPPWTNNAAPPPYDPFAGLIPNSGYLDEYYGNYT